MQNKILGAWLPALDSRYAGDNMESEFHSTPSRSIFLLSCVKKKQSSPARAAEMYVSPLFRGMLRYAERHQPDALFVLSAKYELLRPDDVIEPYERTLNDMPIQEVREWASRVLADLGRQTDLDRDHYTILASEKYRRFLLPHLRHYSIPMKGLSIGRQLQFLSERHNP